MKLFFTIIICLISSGSFSQDDSARIFQPGIISTGEFESHPCFTSDGNTMYFVKSTPTFSFWTICVSKKVNGKWTEPEIAPFSGQYSDADPFITKDGQQLYFISNRPVPGKVKDDFDMDIWVMDKTPNGWSEPRNPGSPINSDRNEWYPTVAANGNIYFGSERKDGKGACDLYKCEKDGNGYKPAINMGDSVNTTFNEFEPFISPDESFLVFMGFNPAGLGASDLFISFNRNGTWTKAKNLGKPFSSVAQEYSPLISNDGRYFYWTSRRSTLPPKFDRLTITSYKQMLNSPGNGLGDIYYLPVKLFYEHAESLSK